MPRHIILAGNLDEAARFAHLNCLDGRAWLYVSSADQLRGIDRGQKLHCIGTYQERPDYVDVLYAADARDMEFVT